MSTIKNIFQEALIAEATYAIFVGSGGNLITSNAGLTAALKAEGMSETQATDFLTHWDIVSQQANTPSSTN